MKPSFPMQARGFAFLSVLMLSILLLAIGAAAEGGNITLFDAASGKWQSDYTQKAASVGGTLYIARTDGLYAWNMGEEPRQVMDFSKTGLDGAALTQAEAPMAISQLMSEDGALYALDSKMEGLWRFDERAGVFTKEASFAPGEALLENEKDDHIYTDFLMDRGDVYYTAQNTVSGSKNLIRLNVKSGKAEVVKTNVRLAAPYIPGELLVVEGNMGWLESVSVLDIQTGRLTKKLDISNDVDLIYYEIGLDTLYLVRKGAIFTSVGFDTPVLAARIPILRPLPGSTHLNGGYVALAYEDGVRIYTCDPAAVSDVSLSFVGQCSDLSIEDYSIRHPNVTFAFRDFYPENSMELISHMMSGDGAADIYVLYAGDYHLDALYEKGYFAGLESNETVFDTVDAMYPFLKEQVMRDGKITALPFYSRYDINMYSPSAFAQVGLSEDDVPATYEGLLDFIQMWGESYREKYPEMSVFGQGVDIALYKRILASSIMEDRMYACIRNGQPVTYDTPEMRALLNKLMTTDFEVINAPNASNHENPDPYQPPMQLFGILFTATTQKVAYTDFFSYMPLSLSEKEEPVVLCNPQVLIVNPYSRHYDTALAFAEYVAASMPDVQREDMMPGVNEPLRDPNFNVTQITETISKLEEIIKTAKDEDKRFYQDQLHDWNQQLELNMRFEWLTTSDSIAAFRGLGSYFMLKQPNPFIGMSSNQEMNDLFYNRFLQGKITVEQFLKEMDQKMRMIEREE